MSREELLAQMAASINYSLEDAAEEVYPGLFSVRHKAPSTDPKVLAHWTRRRYDMATHLLAEVKAGELRMKRARALAAVKKAEQRNKANEHLFTEAASALSPENQRVVPVR